jgi:import inner membrane translocase subunit TIM23
MSFLGGLFGLSTPQPEKKETSASADLFGQTTFRSNVNEGASAQQNPDAALADQGPSQPSGASAVPEAPSSLAMLKGAYDASALHPLANIGDNLDFLALDEDKLTDVEGAASVLPSRGWTDDLCVGTGTTYLSGALRAARSFLALAQK